MRAVASIVIIFGFIAMAVFGTLVMNHSMMQYVGCVASSSATISCPMNQISLFLHHAAAVQLFSTALPISSYSATILFALLFASAAFFKFVLDPLLQLGTHHLRICVSAPHLCATRKFTHWLSLFELSPSL